MKTTLIATYKEKGVEHGWDFQMKMFDDPTLLKLQLDLLTTDPDILEVVSIINGHFEIIYKTPE